MGKSFINNWKTPTGMTKTVKEELTCISCKKRITNLEGTARFMCPKCDKYEIIRCGHCRVIVAKYNCPGCSFVGPN